MRAIGVDGEFLSSDDRRTAVQFGSACTFSVDCLKSPVIDLCSSLVGILPIMMRKTLFATWGILLLFSADHAAAAMATGLPLISPA